MDILGVCPADAEYWWDVGHNMRPFANGWFIVASRIELNVEPSDEGGGFDECGGFCADKTGYFERLPSFWLFTLPNNQPNTIRRRTASNTFADSVH